MSKPDDHTASAMPYRELGRTEEKVSAIGLGGWHLGLKHVSEQLSIRIIRRAIDQGVTFMDNSWDYNDGASEVRMGKALRDGYRDKVFLMTKIDGRSRREAARQLEESLPTAYPSLWMTAETSCPVCLRSGHDALRHRHARGVP